MSDSRTRVLSPVLSAAAPSNDEPHPEPLLEPGLADVVTLERRKTATVSTGDEQSLFLDTVAEYQWARDTAGLAPATLDGLTKPIIEICRYYGLTPWRLTPRRSTSTSRAWASGPGRRSAAK